MKRRRHRHETFGQALAHRLGIPALIFLIFLVLIRLMLPYFVRDFVNQKLAALHGYRGRVAKVRIDLYRGAYTIVDLRIVKTGGKVPVPFFTVPEMDLSVDWDALFRGAMVARIVMDRPQVNFVSGPTEQQKQVGTNEDWAHTLESISPFTINRFEVRDGRIHFFDPYRQPVVNLYITNLFATVTNLTNVRGEGGLPAGLVAKAKTIGGGDLALEMHMNPLAPAPTYKLLASLTNVNLIALNPFFRAYAKFDVARGSFALITDVSSSNGHYVGYAKPFLFDLQVFSFEKEAKKRNPLLIVWEAVVGGVTELFRNQPENQLATVIPISGDYKKGTKIDLLTTIGGILQNAFVEALSPKFIKPVPMPPAQAQARVH